MRQKKQYDNPGLASLVSATRKARGLTLRDVADKIHAEQPEVTITHVTIYRLEKGKTRSRYSTLRAVAKALGLDPELLFHAAA